jgi:hypothetical protein
MKELKEVLCFAVCLGNAVGESLKDGELTYGDAMNFWEPLSKLDEAADGIESVVDELKNMDEAKAAELVLFVKDELDIPQDGIEEVIEAGLDLALGVSKFILLCQSKIEE